MPEFHLDKSGMKNGVSFDKLDEFTQGYIEALFFTNAAPSVYTEEFLTPEHQARMESGQADGNIPADVGYDDLEPETLGEIIGDCTAFQEANSALLEQAYAVDAYDAAHAGRDFWYTRCGHGVGFWEGDLPESIGDALAEQCGYGTRWPSKDVMFDGDKKTVYLF